MNLYQYVNFANSVWDFTPSPKPNSYIKEGLAYESQQQKNLQDQEHGVSRYLLGTRNGYNDREFLKRVRDTYPIEKFDKTTRRIVRGALDENGLTNSVSATKLDKGINPVEQP